MASSCLCFSTKLQEQSAVRAGSRVLGASMALSCLCLRLARPHRQEHYEPQWHGYASVSHALSSNARITSGTDEASACPHFACAKRRSVDGVGVASTRAVLVVDHTAQQEIGKQRGGLLVHSRHCSAYITRRTGIRFVALSAVDSSPWNASMGTG